MHGADLILMLAAALSAALILGYSTQRLGLSPIVGYLIAGVLVGPHTPGFAADAAIAEQLAEVGVILIMFGVGLQFHLEELLSVRRVAMPGAVVGMTFATVLGAWVGRAFGWSWPAGIMFGLTLSVASTVVLVRVLSDARKLHTPVGHIALGWLVMEDLLTVVVLVLLPTLAIGQLTPGQLALDVTIALLKVSALIVFAAVVGQRLIPALLDRVAATRSRELFTLAILVLALGIAVGAALLFGVSMALGAFAAGMVVNRSDYSVRAASDALPLRDAFAVLFFVSVGMLLDPSTLLREPWLVAAALGVVLVGKPLVVASMLALMRYPLRTVLAVPSALAQIGEFSFILAGVGRRLDVLPQIATDVVVAVSIASIVINPLASRLIGPAERTLLRLRRQSPIEDAEQPTSSSLDPQTRAIVVGYGPTGRTVTRLLRENGISPTVVELNMDTVRQLRQDGVSAVYGDARQTDSLVTAGLRHAGTLIVSGADTGSPEIIQGAREINPGIDIFVRSVYLRDVPQLKAAGAEQVFSGEGEVALAMTEAVLRRLGATADQVDRERDRVRDELFGKPVQ
ncbi:MAG TPA: cation:proton antiporter [Vicinamibacterales bacterium]|jgi:CPA2 family monovalent cation:H+ antiporter-2|nr:cation:proton antiporter [Vicinamibacterales bacterium]